jgi:ribonuclease HII
MVLILGTDEAGRGPVIGPMVIAGVMIDVKDDSKLKNMGVKDSKMLTVRQREGMFEQIKEMAEEEMIVVIPPMEIDQAVESDVINLNWLEAIKISEIINTMEPDIAYIDCPSNNLKAFKDYVAERVKNKKVKLVVEHKADQKHLVCGAASILAKVTRDHEIKKLQAGIEVPIGSGYPSDPVTKKFLAKHYKSHQLIIRHSWASYKNLVKGKNQKKLGEF